MCRMKSRITLLTISLLILGLLSTISCMEVPKEEDIYGIWEGKFHETELLFTFNADGTCLLSFKNSINDEVDKLKGTFEVDFSKYPLPLSIRNIPQLNHGLYTILKFTDNDSLVIADFAPRWRFRPISFEYDTDMTLRKVNGN